MNEMVSNTPELSVSELAGALKRTVEDAFALVRLRGEISGYRGPHGSGHVYFSLKDQNARIDAVIWKGVFSRIKFRPEDGLEVIATGRISTFPGKSSYQIIIEQMEPAGVGALMALLEERRRKLQTEGVFDAARKRPLPYLPEVIGIITSPTGAVIRDMIHRLSDRFPRAVLVWPVRVQGEDSAAEVAAAIRGFNALPIAPKSGPRFSDQGDGPPIAPKSGSRFSDQGDGPPIAPKSGSRFSDQGDGPLLCRPDVIVVARGGGSLEDLWGFNEEIVVRAAAESAIPLVSAIGHETDWTLLDLVADVRAPTPTAAAEMIVPVRADLIAETGSRAARLLGAVMRAQARWRRDFANLARALPAAERALEGPRQRLDRASLRQEAAMRALLDRRTLALGRLAHRLGAQTPAAQLASVKARLAGLAARLPGLRDRRLKAGQQALQHASQRLMRAMAARVTLEKRDVARRKSDVFQLGKRLVPVVYARLDREKQSFAARAQLLASLSYRSVLARGYAVVRDDKNAVLRSAVAVSPGQGLSIELADGHLQAIATGGKAPAVTPVQPRAAKPKGRPADQGSLF
jgi:exodeoxyribonuclease VII large subunit